MNHQVTRRMTTPSKTTTQITDQINGGIADERRLSSEYATMEMVDNDQQRYQRIIDVAHSCKSGARRRRRKATSISIASYLKGFSRRNFQRDTIQRDTVRYFRRSPVEAYTVVTLVLGALFFLCLLFSSILEKQQQSKIPPVQWQDHPIPEREVPSLSALHLGSDWNSNRHSRKKGPFYKKSKEEGRTLHHARGTDNKNANVRRSALPNYRRSTMTTASFDIVFPHVMETTGSPTNVHWKVPSMSSDDTKDGETIDYGGLDIELLEEKVGESYRRKIDNDPWWMINDLYQHQSDEENDFYYAFDDDQLRSEPIQDEENEGTGHCRRISEHRVNFPNCNMFHETEQIDNHVKYLSEGAYRQVFVLDHHFEQQQEKIIVKDIGYVNDFETANYEFVRMDAMVAERLTSSPRIYSIYGFCGQGIISEYFRNGDLESVAILGDGKPEEGYQTQPLKSYNNMTGIQKLIISLQMAEAVADLHGFSGGVITHQDIQLSQFLYNNDATRVILNDFNRAEFMLWDDEHQAYCKYTEGTGHGDWRSPEEYYDYPLDEKIDVYSLGNNMYSILTGLWVFFDSKSDRATIKRIQRGETPWIDPRYHDGDLAEAKLATIIPRCFEYYPEKRPSIFDVVGWLREAVKAVKDVERKTT